MPLLTQIPDYTRSSAPILYLKADIPHSLRAVEGGGRQKTNTTTFFVSLLSQIVSVDWYKHWLTWADDYTVYGTHMLALVSLINPIRSFGGEGRLIHMLLIAPPHTQTHTHSWPFCKMVAFFLGNVRCGTKLFWCSPLTCVTSFVTKKAMN